VVQLRTSRLLIPSTSPFFKNPSLIYKEDKVDKKEKIDKKKKEKINPRPSSPSPPSPLDMEVETLGTAALPLQKTSANTKVCGATTTLTARTTNTTALCSMCNNALTSAPQCDVCGLLNPTSTSIT
jgi:hypothetical protein